MIAYLLATLIGFSLGIMGGGGSILTVPILVYVLGMDAKLSIALSLAYSKNLSRSCNKLLYIINLTNLLSYQNR